MSSGRVQLAAIGLQDDFLTGDPEVTYFVKKFSRHTKFALEVMEATFDQQGYDFGSFITCKIPRNGQLIRGMYLKLVLPDLKPDTYGYTDSIGNAIIEYADLLIGGKVVERINGEYMQIYSQAFLGESQQNALKYMIGDTKNGLGGLGPASTNPISTQTYFGPYPRTMIVPLPFYFHRSDSLAIPLCALTRQEVEVHIKLRPLSQLIAYGEPTPGELVSWQPLAITAIEFSAVTWMQFSLVFALMNKSPFVYLYNTNTTSLIPISVSPLNAFHSCGICELQDPTVVVVSSHPCEYPMVYSATNIFGFFVGVPGVPNTLAFNGVASDAATNVLAICTTAEIVLVNFQGGSPQTTVITTPNVFTAVTWSAQNGVFILGTDEPNLYSFDVGTQTMTLFSANEGPYYLDYTPGQYLVDSVPIAWDGRYIACSVTQTVDFRPGSTATQAVPAFSKGVAWSPLFKQFMVVGNYGGFHVGTEPLLGQGQTVVKSAKRLQASLPVEYVFLGDDEIAVIQNAKIDYVITQLQQNQVFIPPGVTSVPIRLDFINCAKELFIVIQDQSVLDSNDVFNYKNTWTNGDQLQSLRLDFNGETYLSDAIGDELYLSIVTFLNAHTRVPDAYVYCLPFAIDPENHLPSGQINMSRIYNKNAYLTTTPNPNARNARIYCKAHNILRIACGMAGVMFTDSVTF